MTQIQTTLMASTNITKSKELHVIITMQKNSQDDLMKEIPKEIIVISYHMRTNICISLLDIIAYPGLGKYLFVSTHILPFNY